MMKSGCDPQRRQETMIGESTLGKDVSHDHSGVKTGCRWILPPKQRIPVLQAPRELRHDHEIRAVCIQLVMPIAETNQDEGAHFGPKLRRHVSRNSIFNHENQQQRPAAGRAEKQVSYLTIQETVEPQGKKARDEPR